MIFWTKFAQEGCYQSKTEKMNIVIKFYIFIFSLSWQFWFFGPSLPKRGNSSQKRRSEHHHWILHIKISLGTKFYLKLTILIFLFYQICAKREFPVENGKIIFVHASMVVSYSIKFFRTGTNRQHGILMSLLFVVAETIKWFVDFLK